MACPVPTAVPEVLLVVWALFFVQKRPQEPDLKSRNFSKIAHRTRDAIRRNISAMREIDILRRNSKRSVVEEELPKWETQRRVWIRKPQEEVSRPR